MSEWKDIASAPKDGTVILGINDYWFSDGAPIKVRFVDGEWEAVDIFYVLGRAHEVPDPTHWQPLLSPPLPQIGARDE